VSKNIGITLPEDLPVNMVCMLPIIEAIFSCFEKSIVKYSWGIAGE